MMVKRDFITTFNKKLPLFIQQPKRHLVCDLKGKLCKIVTAKFLFSHKNLRT